MATIHEWFDLTEETAVRIVREYHDGTTGAVQKIDLCTHYVEGDAYRYDPIDRNELDRLADAVIALRHADVIRAYIDQRLTTEG